MTSDSLASLGQEQPIFSSPLLRPSLESGRANESTCATQTQLIATPLAVGDRVLALIAPPIVDARAELAVSRSGSRESGVNCCHVSVQTLEPNDCSSPPRLYEAWAQTSPHDDDDDDLVFASKQTPVSKTLYPLAIDQLAAREELVSPVVSRRREETWRPVSVGDHDPDAERSSRVVIDDDEAELEVGVTNADCQAEIGGKSRPMKDAEGCLKVETRNASSQPKTTEIRASVEDAESFLHCRVRSVSCGDEMMEARRPVREDEVCVEVASRNAGSQPALEVTTSRATRDDEAGMQVLSVGFGSQFDLDVAMLSRDARLSSVNPYQAWLEESEGPTDLGIQAAAGPVSKATRGPVLHDEVGLDVGQVAVFAQTDVADARLEETPKRGETRHVVMHTFSQTSGRGLICPNCGVAGSVAVGLEEASKRRRCKRIQKGPSALTATATTETEAEAETPVAQQHSTYASSDASSMRLTPEPWPAALGSRPAEPPARARVYRRRRPASHHICLSLCLDGEGHLHVDSMTRHSGPPGQPDQPSRRHETSSPDDSAAPTSDGDDVESPALRDRATRSAVLQRRRSRSAEELFDPAVPSRRRRRSRSLHLARHRHAEPLMGCRLDADSVNCCVCRHLGLLKPEAGLEEAFHRLVAEWGISGLQQQVEQLRLRRQCARPADEPAAKPVNASL
ncbi:unnamed protein product [Protopolystoma xenopodis]|uniref:Uncharacterized protein n=1 Tax=Protopolystoma xenopodis TaxID=117903 RepID=A0A448WSF8_9PLAT|nr:unnamed protein product [Protopolystoma xenopodis]